MVLEVKNMDFAYGDKLILDDISFSLEEGKLVGLLGENGVGKTTLFKCILGFLEADRGSVFLDGQDIRKLPLKERARKIAYIPQSHYPSFNHQVINVVEMGSNVRLGVFDSPSEKERKRAEEILKLLDIEDLAYRGYKEISGGERQLVLIARALMQDARILIMDEPTANLDYGNQIKVLKTCKDLSRLGYSIIQSSHHPQHAFLFFDQVILMHDHKILGHGGVVENLTEDNLKKIYGIDLRVLEISNDSRKEYMIAPRL